MYDKKRIRRKFLLLLTFATSIFYIGWRILYTIPTEYGWLSLIAGVALIVAETISFIEAFEHYRNMSTAVVPDMPEIPADWYPHVDVLIATHNEPTDLLFKTINGCLHLKYPDPSKVHIFLCDDNDRPEMKELANQMGVGYFGLSGNKDAKAGNLNNALAQTQSPLVATFDADMIPMHDFLLETVPYFFLPQMEQDEEGNWIQKTEDQQTEKIGFIQTPQSFYNADLFQYNLYSENRIPNEQDYFFREVNVGRNRTNSAIYAGSNTLISREALDEVGGISVGTITEDFATGIAIQSKGYQCYAIDKTLAHGLAPTTVISLIKQRERWGRGCVQTIRSKAFIFDKNLKLGTKLSYWASFIYWWTFMRRFVYILSPILFTVFHIHVVECSIWELILIWLPSYLLYNHTLRVISGNIRNQRWSNIVDTIIFPYLIIPIFLETIGFKQNQFLVTQKNRSTAASESNLRFALPHAILIVLSVLGLYYSVSNAVVYGSFGNIIVIYWLCVNLFNLIMAVLFMMGRANYRTHERLLAQVPVQIHTEQGLFEGETIDLSEMGLSLYTDSVALYDQEICTLKISYEDLHTEFQARLVHVNQKKEKTKVSFEIVNISKLDKQAYYQIIYDRHHSYPNTLNQRATIFNDMAISIQGRRSRAVASNRKRPRIEINRPVASRSGHVITLENYNYQFMLISGVDAGKESYTIDLEIEETIRLVLDPELSAQKEEGQWMYRVENAKDLHDNPRFLDLLSIWQSRGSSQDSGQQADLVAVKG